ncbi:MAG: class I SAM-dependent methyltransferase [bacterium]|nr:class I SAM-dependent methyltransferase [bacterium]
MNDLEIIITEPSEGYSLIDSGDGEKLEKWGNVLVRRPDPQSLWKKRLDDGEWKKASAVFSRSEADAKWVSDKDVPDSWNISFDDMKLKIKLTAFKHTGLFPEQIKNWEWMREVICGKTRGKAVDNMGESSPENEGFEVLNLFGYTGGASLSASLAGAKVVHVDSSKSAVAWARENAELSGLKDNPIRWILEDARLFVEREIKRGRKYDGIILDPPAFGHGANNEIWKIEEDFMPLIENCISLLKPDPSFFILNGYSAGYSALAYKNNLLPLVLKFGGEIGMGELAIRELETEKGKNDGRLLPCGIFARWKK